MEIQGKVIYKSDHGKKLTEKDMSQFKSDIAATAWEYAHWMMHHRPEKLTEIFNNG